MDLESTRVAYHEAGHALMAHRLGGQVREVTLESDGDDEGRTDVAWRGVAAGDRRRRSALVALAGPVAETLWRGEEPEVDLAAAFRADQVEVDAALAELANPDQRVAVLRRWLFEVVRQLRDPTDWEILCRIADALEAHGTLDGAMLDDLLG